MSNFIGSVIVLALGADGLPTTERAGLPCAPAEYIPDNGGLVGRAGQSLPYASKVGPYLLS
jgi:hypothetical protein